MLIECQVVELAVIDRYPSIGQRHHHVGEISSAPYDVVDLLSMTPMNRLHEGLVQSGECGDDRGVLCSKRFRRRVA
jgi:hypothetical protein